MSFDLYPSATAHTTLGVFTHKHTHKGLERRRKKEGQRERDMERGRPKSTKRINSM